MTQTPPEASREKIENMFFFQWNILSSSDITDAKTATLTSWVASLAGLSICEITWERELVNPNFF